MFRRYAIYKEIRGIKKSRYLSTTRLRIMNLKSYSSYIRLWREIKSLGTSQQLDFYNIMQRVSKKFIYKALERNKKV